MIERFPYRSQVVASIPAFILAGSLSACSHSSAEIKPTPSHSATPETMTTTLPPVTPSAAPKVAFDAALCSKFEVSLGVGEGVPVKDLGGRVTYYVANLGQTESIPNNPNSISLNTVEIKHYPANSGETRLYTYDYGSTDNVFEDGSSVHIQIKSLSTTAINASGWVCEPSDFVKPSTPTSNA